MGKTVTTRILVDSTADIPPERARELGITVVPLTVLFGDESFLDGVELDGTAFYRRLVSSQQVPTTSTPSPGLFEEAYRNMISGGATAILALHIGSGLSGTFSASQAAAEAVTASSQVPIAVLDSRSVSGGCGLPAEIVAAEARDGASLQQVKAHAESLIARVRLVAVLDTLEYLKRGGRIGSAQATLGTLLNVKPLLEVRDSQVVPLERVRTRSKALERIGQIISGLGPLEALGICQSDTNIGQELQKVARTFWSGTIEMF